MNVVLMGQPFWIERLKRLFDGYRKSGISITTVPVSRVPRLSALRALAAADVIVRVGFRPGALTARGIAFDLLWTAIARINRSAALVTYWIGSDVLATVRSSGKTSPLGRRIIEQSEHWAGAPWFVGSLARVGILARSMVFPSELPVAATVALPETFKVASYVPNLRPRFYGSDTIIFLANEFPDIDFVIFGGTGESDDWPNQVPPNVRFLGWVDSMSDVYSDVVAVLRLVEHDAIGGSVREALACARHVIYTFDIPHVMHVPFGDKRAARAAVELLKEKHRTGDLQPNRAGQDYVISHFGTDRLVETIVERLHEIGPSSRRTVH